MEYVYGRTPERTSYQSVNSYHGYLSHSLSHEDEHYRSRRPVTPRMPTRYEPQQPDDFLSNDGSDDITSLIQDPGDDQDCVTGAGLTGDVSLSPERIRLIRTISMLLFYLCLGLSAGILSPAAIDLMSLYGCDVAQLGLIFMNKAFGMLLGSFCGALISNRFRSKSDVLLSMVIMMFGLANAALPWSSDPWIAGVIMFIIGTMHGTINVVCSSLTIAEWGERAPTPINALHFALTVGMMLAPPTTAPFLAKPDNNTTNGIPPHGISHFHIFGNEDNLNSFVHTIANNSSTQSRVFIPFAMHGSLAVCTGLLFLAFYCAGWEYESTRRRIRTESGSLVPIFNTQTDRKFKLIMAISLFLIYICIVNSNTSVTTYIFYIAVTSSIHMSKSRAALFNTIYSGSWVVGRLLATITAKFVKIHYLVFFSVIAVMTNSILLAFFGLETEISFWILTCAVGVFSGPCYPSVMAWADRYIEMEGVMVAVVDVGIGTGGFLALYLGGYLLQHKGPLCIFYMTAAASTFLFILIAAVQFGVSFRGDRFEREQTRNTTHDRDTRQTDRESSRHC